MIQKLGFKMSVLKIKKKYPDPIYTPISDITKKGSGSDQYAQSGSATLHTRHNGYIIQGRSLLIHCRAFYICLSCMTVILIQIRSNPKQKSGLTLKKKKHQILKKKIPIFRVSGF